MIYCKDCGGQFMGDYTGYKDDKVFPIEIDWVEPVLNEIQRKYEIEKFRKERIKKLEKIVND